MRPLPKTVAFVISFAFVGSAISAAFAQTQWERNHPRRDQVNDRPNQRHREDHAIRQEERDMAKINGGHITQGEQKVLNQLKTRSAAKLGVNNLTVAARATSAIKANAPAFAGAFCFRLYAPTERIIYFALIAAE